MPSSSNLRLTLPPPALFRYIDGRCRHMRCHIGVISGARDLRARIRVHLGSKQPNPPRKFSCECAGRWCDLKFCSRGISLYWSGMVAGAAGRSQQIDEPTRGKGFGGLRLDRSRRRIAAAGRRQAVHRRDQPAVFPVPDLAVAGRLFRGAGRRGLAPGRSAALCHQQPDHRQRLCGDRVRVPARPRAAGRRRVRRSADDLRTRRRVGALRVSFSSPARASLRAFGRGAGGVPLRADRRGGHQSGILAQPSMLPAPSNAASSTWRGSMRRRRARSPCK